MSEPTETSPSNPNPAASEPAAVSLGATAEPLERVLGCLIELFPLALLTIIPFIGGLLTAAYVLLRDGIFPGQSIGKRIMKTQVVLLQTGKPASFRESAIRNAPLAINFFVTVLPVVGHFVGGIVGLLVLIIETVAIFTDKDRRRLGDKLAGTMVVKMAA